MMHCIVAVVKHETQILEERFATGVLLALLENGPMIKGNLTAYLSSGSKAVSERVKGLQDAGLVIEIKEEKRPFRKFVNLTPLGHQVAELLQQIEELLEKD